MTLDKEKTATLLRERVTLARSRRNTRLTTREIDEIIAVLESYNLIAPSESVRNTKPTVTWIGIDEGNGVRYDDSKKSNVLTSWMADINVERNKVQSVHSGEGAYFYSVPVEMGKVQSLSLIRSDVAHNFNIEGFSPAESAPAE
jgi:hypothetical protein